MIFKKIYPQKCLPRQKKPDKIRLIFKKMVYKVSILRNVIAMVQGININV